MSSFRHFFMLYGDDYSDHDSWVRITRYRHSKLISDGDPLAMNLRYLYLIDFHPVIVLNEVSEDAHVIDPIPFNPILAPDQFDKLLLHDADQISGGVVDVEFSANREKLAVQVHYLGVVRVEHRELCRELEEVPVSLAELRPVACCEIVVFAN